MAVTRQSRRIARKPAENIDGRQRTDLHDVRVSRAILRSLYYAVVAYEFGRFPMRAAAG